MITIDVRTYAEKMDITTATVYKQIDKKLLNTIIINGKKHIIIDDDSKFDELLDLKSSSFKFGDKSHMTIDEDSESFKLIKKSFKEIIKSFELQAAGYQKTIKTLEKQIALKEETIKALHEQNKDLLTKVLDESQETKNVYAKLTNLLLPEKNNRKESIE